MQGLVWNAILNTDSLPLLESIEPSCLAVMGGRVTVEVAAAKGAVTVEAARNLRSWSWMRELERSARPSHLYPAPTCASGFAYRNNTEAQSVELLLLRCTI